MKREKYNDLNHKNLIHHPVKFTSVVVLLSSVLFGYGVTIPSPSVGAQDQSDATLSQNVDKRKQNLASRIQAAQAEVERLKNITDQDKAQLKTDISQSKSIDDVDTLLKEIQAQQEATVQKGLSEKQAVNPDSPQTANASNIVDRIDALSKKLNQDTTNASSQISNVNDKIADPRLDSTQANQNVDQLIADLDNLSHKVNKDEPNTDTASAQNSNHTIDNTEHQFNNLRQDINRMTSNQNQASGQLDQFVQNKEANLQALESKLSQRQGISKAQADQLKSEIDKTRNSLKQQDSIILDRLNNTNDKRQAVKDLIGHTVDEQQAQTILNRIDTKGKTDAQIASQVLSQLDGLSSFTSDSLLESMFDKANDKEALIQTLLSTKFDQQEASDMAKNIMSHQPNSAEIVKLLKQHYGSNISADDILSNVLDQAHNQRQAIETILATKFNDAKARALADMITKKENKKDELLQLMTSDIDRHLNDLLQADNDINRLKSQIHGIFDPLKGTPSLLNRTHDNSLLDGLSGLLSGPSLLDKVLDGKGILDGIPDIPNPSQGRALSLVNPSDDFLSGLFDDNGNFDLPAAGEVVKHSFIPLGIGLVLIGGGVTWLVKRRKTDKA